MSNLIQVLAKPDLRTEVLSYISLRDVQDGLRGVCKDFRTEADNYKASVVEALLSSQDQKVLITDLQSEKGKMLNGRIECVHAQKKRWEISNSFERELAIS